MTTGRLNKSFDDGELLLGADDAKRVPLIVHDDDDFDGCTSDEGNDSSTPPRKCAWIWPALTLFGCSIGGGLVALPKAFANIHIGWATIIYLIAGSFSALGMDFLAGIAELTGARSYGQTMAVIARAAKREDEGTFRRLARRSAVPLINFLIGCILLGVVAAGFSVMEDCLDGLHFKDANAKDATKVDSAWAGKITAAIACGVALPLSLPKNIGSLKYGAMFATLSYVFLVATLIGRGTYEATKHSESKRQLGPLFGAISMAELFTSAPVIIYTLGCQIQLQSIYAAQPRALRSRRRFRPAVLTAVCLMFVLFISTGVTGLLSFPPGARRDFAE